MKANYKVINNKQVQLRKVIEEFKPDAMSTSTKRWDSIAGCWATMKMLLTRASRSAA